MLGAYSALVKQPAWALRSDRGTAMTAADGDAELEDAVLLDEIRLVCGLIQAANSSECRLCPSEIDRALGLQQEDEGIPPQGAE